MDFRMTNNCELCEVETNQGGYIMKDVILLCRKCYEMLLENSGMDK